MMVVGGKENYKGFRAGGDPGSGQLNRASRSTCDGKVHFGGERGAAWITLLGMGQSRRVIWNDQK